MSMLNEDQLRLFEPQEQQLRPGQMTPDQWTEAHYNDLVYHGTARSDWEEGPVAHMGTKRSAEGRVEDVVNELSRQSRGTQAADRYLGPKVASRRNLLLPPEPHDLTAAVHMRRLAKEPLEIDEPIDDSTLSDSIANRADLKYRKSLGHSFNEISESIRTSANWVPAEHEYRAEHEAVRAADALKEGTPVAYTNTSEGAGDTSYVVPKGAARSWEQDVLDDPDAPAASRAYAQQRKEAGTAGKVPFNMQVPSPERPIQNRLFDRDAIDGTDFWGKSVGSPSRTVNEYQFRTN